MLKTFQDLTAWQKAHALVLLIYDKTTSFPIEERFGLTAQFRRAAVSVPANLAEGFRKRTKNDKLKFYSISQTSLEEVRYYSILSNDLGYFKSSELDESIEEVAKLLEGLISSIENSNRY